MQQITDPGMYEDFPIADYFADPCPVPSLSQSIAKLIIDGSPAHARINHPRLSQQDEADEEKYVAARTIGDVAHSLILGRGKAVCVCDFPDWRTKAAQAARDEAIADGLNPILAKHNERAQEIAAAFASEMETHEAKHPAGRAEIVLAWTEGEFWFRSLVDHLSLDGRLVTDLKTTAMHMPPQEIGRKMADDGWDIQAAMIERGLNVLDPANRGRRTFRFISIEQSKPYGIVVNELTENVLTMGRKKLAHAIEVWKHCFKSNLWPTYPPKIQRPEYPPWAEAKWLAREGSMMEEAR